jgi:hypothetical protein
LIRQHYASELSPAAYVYHGDKEEKKQPEVRTQAQGEQQKENESLLAWLRAHPRKEAGQQGELQAEEELTRFWRVVSGSIFVSKAKMRATSADELPRFT